ncbi:MAG: hypothetical protein K9M75_13355, partial [Phycisphaerae bacterium]|nr:hypothetical protein [Phycisphaerae bacterium]
MEFIRLDEIDSRNFSGVFKNSYFESTAILVFYTILQILGIWGYISGIIPLLALAIICLFCVVLIYKCILDIVKKLKPTNWLIAITDNYIYIKFRSYLYNQFKNDHQVFCLNPPEIQAFRIIQITDVISRGRSKTHCLSTYLDIFVSESLSELSNILKLEYKNIGIKKTSKSKLEISRLDFPVIVLQKNIIRVDISELSPKKELLAAKFKTSGLEELENVEEVV